MLLNWLTGRPYICRLREEKREKRGKEIQTYNSTSHSFFLKLRVNKRRKRNANAIFSFPLFFKNRRKRMLLTITLYLLFSFDLLALNFQIPFLKYHSSWRTDLFLFSVLLNLIDKRYQPKLFLSRKQKDLY